MRGGGGGGGSGGGSGGGLGGGGGSGGGLGGGDGGEGGGGDGVRKHELAGPLMGLVQVNFAWNAVAPANIPFRDPVVAADPVHVEMSWLNA